MRTYRHVWTVVVTVATAAAVVGAVLGDRIGIVVVSTALMAGLGAGFAAAFGEEQRVPWRAVRTMAGGFGLVGLVGAGLPVLIGPWTLLLLAVLLLLHPHLLDLLSRRRRVARPTPAPAFSLDDPDPDPWVRWRASTTRLQRPGLGPEATLRLVQERAALLDELERRDPDRFAAWLVRSGWREPQDR